MEDNDAFEVPRALATREGLFLGMSSGAAVAGALRIAKKWKGELSSRSCLTVATAI